MYWTLHRFRRLCEGQEGRGRLEARLSDTETQKKQSLSGCFSRSDGINDCNSERLSLCICLHLGNTFPRGKEAGCMFSPLKQELCTDELEIL